MTPQQSPPLLEVTDLSLEYGGLRALDNVSLTVGTGEIVAVLGANGAGKSSLIKAIYGAEPFKSGDIRFEGVSIGGQNPNAVARCGIGLVPEGRKIFPSLSVEENIRLGATIGGRTASETERIFELFPELDERRNVSGTLVSGGQQQMIAIGRALMARPRLLLCDEISLGLAPTVVDRLYAVLRKLAADGTAVLIVEQETSRALKASARYYCLLEGEVSAQGKSSDADPTDIAKAYFGGDRD
jgi:branched-chain amino acid transport system ATP-binding protein